MRVVDDRLASGDDWLAGVVDAAAAALRRRRVAVAADLLGGVLGRGRGLTPSGDDAVAGLLLTARALAIGPDQLSVVQDVGRRVAALAPDRTTSVSAALLSHVVDGRGAAVVVDAVDAVVGRPHPRGVDGSALLERLLAVGHSSGVDTAVGVLAAARHLATTAPDTTAPDTTATAASRSRPDLPRPDQDCPDRDRPDRHLEPV